MQSSSFSIFKAAWSIGIADDAAVIDIDDYLSFIVPP